MITSMVEYPANLPEAHQPHESAPPIADDQPGGKMCNKCNNKPERPAPLVAISQTPSKEETTASLAYTVNSVSDTSAPCGRISKEISSSEFG